MRFLYFGKTQSQLVYLLSDSRSIVNDPTNGQTVAKDNCVSKNNGSDTPRCPWSSFIFLFQPVQGWEYNAEKYREAIIKEELCKVPVESDWGLYPLGIGGFPTNKEISLEQLSSANSAYHHRSLEQMRKEYHEYCPKSKSNNIVYCPDQIIKRKKDEKLQWINDYFKNFEKKIDEKRRGKKKKSMLNTDEKVNEIKEKVKNLMDKFIIKLDDINIKLNDINQGRKKEKSKLNTNEKVNEIKEKVNNFKDKFNIIFDDINFKLDDIKQQN